MANVKVELPIEKLIEEYQRGASLRQLAMKYYISHTAIYDRFKELNIDMSIKRHCLSKEELKELYKEYSLEEISQMTEIPKSTVYSMIKKYKIKYKKRFNRKHFRILFMWEQTHNKTLIARMVGVNETTVYNVLKAYNQYEGASDGKKQGVSGKQP